MSSVKRSYTIDISAASDADWKQFLQWVSAFTEDALLKDKGKSPWQPPEADEMSEEESRPWLVYSPYLGL